MAESPLADHRAGDRRGGHPGPHREQPPDPYLHVLGSGSNHSTTTASTIPPSTTTTTILPPSQVKVQVLNGVLTGNLASEWSAKLKNQFGYITLPPDNATEKVPTSIIYVLTPGYQPEAQHLATSVGLPASAVFPEVPAPATAPIPASARTSANLVLIIGPDLAATS